MPLPNNNQLYAFGAIIHYYACAESGIKITLAGMLEIDLTELLILTEPYSSFNLRKVATSIARERFQETPETLQFFEIIAEFGTYGALRNNIGHSRWTKGTRRNSIKPFKIDIRSGTVKFLGGEDEERDWTTKELVAEANKLSALNTRIVQFMKDTGIAARMAQNTEANRQAIEASEGKPANSS